jgi:hypothetical protein
MKLLTIGQVVKKYGLSLNVSKNIKFSYNRELTKKSIKSIKEYRYIPLITGINT